MARMYHTPKRMCVICRKCFPKQLLRRYVRKTDDTAWQEDMRQRLSGRGVYVCEGLACIQVFTRYGVSRRKRKRDTL